MKHLIMSSNIVFCIHLIRKLWSWALLFSFLPSNTQLLILILGLLFESGGHADFEISSEMWPHIDTFFQQLEKKSELCGYFLILEGL